MQEENKPFKIFIVGGDNEYINWLNAKAVDRIEDADVVMFTGGEDVHPSLYGEPMGAFTGSNLYRDMIEKEAFLKAKELDKPCIGICRGSQFMSVMAGGKLVQHQNNPKFMHSVITSNGQELMVTSTHHQAQFPFKLPKEDYEILAWTEGISEFHLDGNQKEMNPPVEVEICYYRKTKSLGIQCHPEMMVGSHPETFEYLTMLVNKYLLANINQQVEEVVD
jgi:GMP synthase-like glutamine amidotransferase